MEKTTLHQVLSEREEKRREDAAEQLRRREAAAVEYTRLIKNGSSKKADVDALLATAETLGKSPSDMKSDLATFEAGAEAIRELMSYAGSATALQEIASLLQVLSERTRTQIHQLQRQLNQLTPCISAAQERVFEFNGKLADFKKWKRDHPEFLEDYETPNDSHLDDPVAAADIVPEFKAWLEVYVELRHVKLDVGAPAGDAAVAAA